MLESRPTYTRGDTMYDIAQGIKQEWLHSGRINAYTLTMLNELILCCWSESVVDAVSRWDPERGPYLTVYDISAPRVAIPYLVQTRYNIHMAGVTEAGQYHVTRLMKERPGLQICMALILSDSSSGGITARKARDNEAYNTVSRVFFSRDAAIDWLAGFLQPAR